MLRIAIIFAIGATLCAAAGTCPGSPVSTHAKAQTTATSEASCSDVAAEIKSRALGTQNGDWVDPHNGGTYKLIQGGNDTATYSRTTGNGQYTDKLTFTFTEVSGEA